MLCYVVEDLDLVNWWLGRLHHTNQEKNRFIWLKKHSKKTLELGKHTILGRWGGEGVSQILKKKLWVLVSFPHSPTPLSCACPFPPLVIITQQPVIRLTNTSHHATPIIIVGSPATSDVAVKIAAPHRARHPRRWAWCSTHPGPFPLFFFFFLIYSLIYAVY